MVRPDAPSLLTRTDLEGSLSQLRRLRSGPREPLGSLSLSAHISPTRSIRLDCGREIQDALRPSPITEAAHQVLDSGALKTTQTLSLCLFATSLFPECP